jgi:hypothetical protein
MTWYSTGRYDKPTLSAVILVVLIATGLLIYGYCLHRQARAVLDDVFTLTAAPDREAAFIALRSKYGNRLMPEGCSGDLCSYHLSVSNRFLSMLVRIPYAELNVRFDLRGKLVSLVMVDYRSALSGRTSPTVNVQTDFCVGRCGDFDIFYVHPWTETSTAERWNGSVEMGNTTVPQLRRAALSLNTSCLTSIRGCSDIAQLMPEIWKPTADGVRCALANRTGRVR